MPQICTKCDNCRLFVVGLCNGLRRWDLLKCAELREEALAS